MIDMQASIKIIYWLPCKYKYYVECLEHIFKHTFASVQNESIKQKWENTYNYLFPKNSLGYKSDEEYLIDNNLTKEEVITNSICHVLKEVDQKDLTWLMEKFTILTTYNKIKIAHYETASLPIYPEIIFALNYVQSIKKLLKKYPKNFANHLGSRYSASSFKNLVTTQINKLKERLNNPFFPLENQEEIDKTKLQIRFLEVSLQDDFKFFPELFSYARSLIGLDASVLGMSSFEQKVMAQILSLLNGAKTQPEEYVKSVMIYLRALSKIPNDVSNQELKSLADSILAIARYFFLDVFKEAEKDNETRLNQLTYTKKYPLKTYHIKTIIDDIEIYTYTHKNSFDFLKDIQKAYFQDLFGIKNVFDPSLPNEEEITEFQQFKNMLRRLKEFHMTKKDIRALFKVVEFITITSEQNKLRVNSPKN